MQKDFTGTSGLTHFDASGAAHMVDVGGKEETLREAVAEGRITMAAETLAKVRTGQMGKGDVLGVARIAAIQGAKRTAELIPLAHPLPLTAIDLHFDLTDEPAAVRLRATVRCSGRTGVEMEALTAVAVGLLTIYDMCKAVDRGMRMEDIRLLRKEGGKSGVWEAEGSASA